MNLILLATIPSLIILFFFYINDKYEKEPFKLILLAFFLGIIITIPAAFIEIAFPKLFTNTQGVAWLAIFYNMSIVAIIEESLKFLILFKVFFKNKEFNEPYDGIIYAVTISLGFAAFENIFFGLSFGQNILFFRAFSAVPMHAFAAVAMGYYLGKAKYTKAPKIKNQLILLGLALPIIIHALYNTFAQTNMFHLILILFFYCFGLTKDAMKTSLKNSPFKKKK